MKRGRGKKEKRKRREKYQIFTNFFSGNGIPVLSHEGIEIVAVREIFKGFPSII
jgi:hypothetical protein